jgi:hypothetical protein
MTGRYNSRMGRSMLAIKKIKKSNTTEGCQRKTVENEPKNIQEPLSLKGFFDIGTFDKKLQICCASSSKTEKRR